MNKKDKIEFASQAYNHSQSMITFADSKANISLSIQSLLISIGLATSVLANVFEHIQDLDKRNFALLFYFFFFVFAVSSVLGLGHSLWVYKARPHLDEKEKKRRGLLYYGHVKQFPSAEEYHAELSKLDEAEVLKEFAFQTFLLSHIANKKMEYVNTAIYFLVANIVLTTLLISLSAYILTL